jgi:predicted anti-sigma-YlaC factor YlaD
MDCQLCQKELDASHEGKMPDGMKVQVETHLENCQECTEYYKMTIITDKVMNEEKSMQSNPFLSTRIMADIEELEQQKASVQSIPMFQKVLKPALIGISVAAAISVGIFMGSITSPKHTINTIPVEMAYMNDAALESVNMFSNE